MVVFVSSTGSNSNDEPIAVTGAIADSSVTGTEPVVVFAKV